MLKEEDEATQANILSYRLAIGPPLPLSSLRLLVSPLRLMYSFVWHVVNQRNVMHYGKVEEFVTVVTEAVPKLLSYKQRAQLILGLRARVSDMLCGHGRGGFDTLCIRKIIYNFVPLF